MIEVIVQDDQTTLVYRKAGHHYWITMPTDDAVDLAYEILNSTQTIEQVMNRVQSDIDDEIEREHGISHAG